MSSTSPIKVNRAPVLTLWAAVVAERLGFARAEALTLGRAVAGLSAHAKGVALGLIEPAPQEVSEQRRRLREGERLRVELLGRAVPVVRTPEGLRALSKDRPIAPSSVERYLAGKFGDALDEVRAVMADLAAALPPEELGRRAFALYERFRPEVPPGERGWGAAGVLDLARLRELARAAARERP
jgi:hypothetical protein